MLPYPPDAAPALRPVLPLERLAAVLEIIICSGIPTQLLLIAVLRGFGFHLQADGGGLNPRFVFAVSLLDAVVVVGLVVMLLRAHRESVRDVLLGRVRLLREALLGIAMIPLIFFVVLVILAVVVMIAGGVREEVQRAFIVHRFGQYLGGGIYGVLIYSVLFGLGHWEQGRDAAIATAILGAIWGLVYLRRGSIVAPVISHAGFNLAQVLKHVALR